MTALRVPSAAALLFSLGLVPPRLAAQSTAAAPAPARLEITPARRELAVGDSLQLSARALDASGKAIPDATIIFRPEGLAAATVDSTGLVRAGGVGDILILVTALIPGGKPVLEPLVLKAVPSPARRIDIGAHPERLVPGQRVALAARVLSAEGDARADSVRWTSSAPGVARVARDGVLEALKPGRTTLTASVAGAVRATTAVSVAAAAPASLTIEPAGARVRQGDVVRFRAVARDAAGKAIEGLTPAWSFGPGQGEIDADGAFVAYEPGTYSVTASLGRSSATVPVTVARREVRRSAELVGTVVRSAFATSEVWAHPTAPVAYLCTGITGDRVYTLDVRDPAKPRIVDSVMVNARHINDVMTDKAGKVLVFTREGASDRKNGIVIATIEDPLHPKVVAEFTDGVTAGVHSAFVYSQPRYGTHVYLTNDGTGALHIVDISDPAHPKLAATWKTPRADAGRYLHDVDVQDGLLYASYWHDGLVILDIGKGVKGGSPSHPQLVSQFKYDLDSLYSQVAEESGPGFVRGTHTAWRHGRYVFVGDEVFGLDALEALHESKPSRAYGRLHVVDVSDIEHPKEVGWYEPEYGGVHNVWVAGDTLYMGAYNAGFRAFDVSGELRGDLRAQGREITSLAPSDSKGFIPNAPMTWGVVVKDGLAYVNDFNSGLYLVRLGEKTRAPLVP
ncbi:MAG TPA: Ig-like domain-containing protein [Gemmatimonadales bacterium]|nr:Ig-like domain-containing protein [Gemmatimonadales bacterium]